MHFIDEAGCAFPFGRCEFLVNNAFLAFREIHPGFSRVRIRYEKSEAAVFYLRGESSATLAVQFLINYCSELDEPSISFTDLCSSLAANGFQIVDRMSVHDEVEEIRRKQDQQIQEWQELSDNCRKLAKQEGRKRLLKSLWRNFTSN
ncbi:MAG: hypothetical protein AAGA67_05510 [Cyanobacteria bacterium P01_F01_bin.153]